MAEREHLEKELLDMTDKERRRIGRDLHDYVQQDLIGINFLAKMLQQKVQKKYKDDSLADDLEQIARLSSKVIRQTREVARGLCPVNMQADGLMVALKEMSDQCSDLIGIPCSFECPEQVLIEDGALATHLFYMAREAVNNAIRHSNASHICVRLTAENGMIRLSIQDNGVGIPLESNHRRGMGMTLMNHRARIIGGALTIQRPDAGGTLLTCSVPVSTLS